MNTLDLQISGSSNGLMAKRKANNIQISDKARAALEEILGESGVPFSKAMENAIYWLKASGPTVAGSVLKLIPEPLRMDVARFELQRLAGASVAEVKGEPTEDQDPMQPPGKGSRKKDPATSGARK